ncbi:MFS transporter [Amycolatopsis tucumanensis]|uniref:DHA2 family efflux MFS transporter permease subunit n=1 Tax=Amycolatopsis tucumanensis TaxID=401106 RepID=A0ABP7HRF2_9PSEU|nr:MFS transporter [Amycolatopsis tucumanensis]MCF6422092.1 MFS transporter [Amycolatopsis tucumanensis]
MLGDRFGIKRFLLGGLALFGLASVACAFADSVESLIVARAFLGLGAACLVSLSMAVLNVLFPGADRGRALAVWSVAVAVGVPLGPVVGGWLLDSFWWGSVFLLNVPFVVVGFVLLAWLVPALPVDRARRADLPGIVLSGAGVVALTFGLIEAGDRGWIAISALGPILAGVALLCAFVVVEGRVRYPLLDLGLFTTPGFRWGGLLSGLTSFVLLGVLFLLPQYFDAVRGAGALEAGVQLLPMVLGMSVGMQVADPLHRRLGVKVVGAGGFLVMAAGLVIGAVAGSGHGYGFVALWVSLVGVGLGCAVFAALDDALGALDPGRSGVGGGVLQVIRQLGGTLGVAILGTVLNAGYRGSVDVGGLPEPSAEAVRDSAAGGARVAESVPDLLGSVRSAFVSGMSAALWVSAALALVGAALAALFLPFRAQDVEAERQFAAR